MAKASPRTRTTRTLAVSGEFADVITTLARAKDLTVEEYCDRFGLPKFAADYESHLTAKLNEAKRLSPASKRGA